MKCNSKKARSEKAKHENARREAKRADLLESMTYEERKKYLEEERERGRKALQALSQLAAMCAAFGIKKRY